jgi:hypothetical protein
VVPWIVLLAIGYGFTLPMVLNTPHPSMISLFQTLGVFNILFCLICAVFVWGLKPKSTPAAQAA